jgi:hypothetical protein
MDFLRIVAVVIWAVVAGAVSAAIGALVSSVLICAGYVIASVQVLFIRPAGLPARTRDFTLPTDGERARPSYFYGPARSDLRYVWQVTWSRWEDFGEWWATRIVDLFDNDAPLEITAPIAVGLGIGSAAALMPGALLMGAARLVSEVLLDFTTVSVRCVALTFRSLDSALLWVRHIRLRCISCFHSLPYPAYLCPQCKTIHWDIRPGRYGVLRRTCECGKRMPTTLLRGSAKLDALCPYRACQQPLEYRPGEIPEVMLPLFGAKGAGKTLMLWSIDKTLRQSVRVESANTDTAARLRELDVAIAAGTPVPATPAVSPKTYVLRLRIGRRKRILQLPDPAGELFYDSRRSADLRYLGAASTFILVIDPLSIARFWDNLPSTRRDQLAAHRSEAPHPDLVYQQTAERIAQFGRRHARRRLAIVFSRADLVGREDGPQVGDSAGIRKWATEELGLAGLLRDAELDFQEVTLFHTAPFGTAEYSLDDLVHWAIRIDRADLDREDGAGSAPG